MTAVEDGIAITATEFLFWEGQRQGGEGGAGNAQITMFLQKLLNGPIWRLNGSPTLLTVCRMSCTMSLYQKEMALNMRTKEHEQLEGLEMCLF